MSHVDHEPLKECTSRELYFPSAFPDLRTLLFTPPSDEASEKRCPAFQKSRTQGLATLSTVSAPYTLGSLFQPPTLLGFALQSFAPSP